MAAAEERPVLILGAGINGAALARELVLNRVPVTVVDTGDISSGASAYSSRLIHGGLRYLEYGEFDLVRESLDERNRLLRLAPQFVRPLRLYIPITNRFGGALTQASHFLGLPAGSSRRGRGLYVVRAGLWMYDHYANRDALPRQSVHQPSDSNVPRVTSPDVRWLAAYSDAQIPRTERFVVALFRDAANLAKEHGVPFKLLTYHEAERLPDAVVIRSTQSVENEIHLEPAAIVNATGAWVDETLQRLHVPSPQLMGGTKGSHFVTFHAGLRAALREQGVYTEAADGRPIFILPFCDGALIGTTDLPFSGDPASAVATEEELDYLVRSVNDVFPDVRLTRGDIAMHYSGVRPLPKVTAGATAAITRRHLWRWHRESNVPMVSLIGGKLTTCRAFAEQTVAELLPKLGRKVEANSHDRAIPGDAEVRASTSSEPLVEGTTIPVAAVIESITDEWAVTLSDLVERRLMLIFEREVRLSTLRHLAQILVEQKRLAPDHVPHEIEACCRRLKTHFGRTVAS